MISTAFTRTGRAFASLCALAILSTFPRGALAQDTPLAAASPAAETIPAETAPARALAPARIETGALPAPDLWGAAIDDVGQSGDRAPWRGADAVLAGAVLSDPSPLPSRALDEALTATLSRGASAPDGAGRDDALAAARYRWLLARGRLAGVAAALARTSRVDESEALSRVRADTLLLIGDENGACETGRALKSGREGEYWLRLRAFCELAAAMPAAAQATLDLWRQRGGRDAGFDRLAGALAIGADPGKAALGDAMQRALSSRAGLDPSPAIDGSTPGPVLASLAQDGRLAWTVRVQAAYFGMRKGSVEPERARAIYEGWASAPAGSPSPTGPSGEPAGLSEARLWAGLAGAGGAPARADLKALLGAAKRPFELQALAALAQPALKALAAANPQTEGPDAELALAAALAGEAGAARALTGAQGGDLLALTAAAAFDRQADINDLIARARGLDAKAAARALAAVGVLAALRPTVPEARAALALSELGAPRSAWFRLAGLSAAAADRRAGELLLLSALIARQKGFAAADAGLVVQALAQGGEATAARALGVEAIAALSRP